MPVDCARSTTGGKGNSGMFIERDSHICAAGLPSAQPDNKVQDSLTHYLLKDEADALIHDSIQPTSKRRPFPPLKHPIALDKRFAGPFSDVAQLINPRPKTKFETLVEEIQDTPYASYWKKQLGKVSDPIPMLPAGFDQVYTTFGKKTPFQGRLYDIVMPKVPYPDNTPLSKGPSVQTKHNYCQPQFDPDLTFGYRTNVDKRGTYAKFCLIDDRILTGKSDKVIINSVQAEFQCVNQPRVGLVLAPNQNIKEVPFDYSFGKLKPPDNIYECLTSCEINPDLQMVRKCLSHLNTLRKVMSTRFLPTFFRGLYLNLKFIDKEKTEWLLNKTVYSFCGTKFIRFDPSLIEPLLQIWDAFGNQHIKYEIFVNIINFTIPLPDLPKMYDLPDACLDFRTTYKEMVKPNQPVDPRPMAGTPSGRYFDMDYPITVEGYSKSHRTCLPQESNMESCLKPNVFTLLHVNHRDMYAKREPNIVRKVFENIGEKFNDETFNTLWGEAQKLHSQGWVCFETFWKVLEKRATDKNTDQN